jgi:spore maturation protein CgeB
LTPRRHYVFLGLTITSTWGNGHATTYRALLKELAARGHTVTFLERDMPWYAANREFYELPYADVQLYGALDELCERFANTVREADVAVVGSYVPDGIAVGKWVREIRNQTRRKTGAIFYDIDTPVTLAALKKKQCAYLSREQVSEYELYLSFTGGPTLDYIEKVLGSPCARALYCSVDPALYFPGREETQWDLGYLGTYAADRQPVLNELLVRVAEGLPKHKFAVAGPQYPAEIHWPTNVERIEHLPASEHRSFYSGERFTLNVTRQDMVRAGHSPSVRLFEAAACGVPIVSDVWPGIEQFFEPGREILLVRNREDVWASLRMSEDERHEIAERARCRTLKCNTAAIRAAEFEAFAEGTIARICVSRRVGVM